MAGAPVALDAGKRRIAGVIGAERREDDCQAKRSMTFERPE